MESRIELATTTNFDLPQQEQKRLYTALALLQYKHDRTPNYNEKALRRRLCHELKRFNTEATKAFENDPNNLRLSQVCNFFQRHYGQLHYIVKHENQEENSEKNAGEKHGG